MGLGDVAALGLGPVENLPVEVDRRIQFAERLLGEDGLLQEFRQRGGGGRGLALGVCRGGGDCRH